MDNVWIIYDWLVVKQTPLKHMSSSLGMIIPNIWKQLEHRNVPNHQPDEVTKSKQLPVFFANSPVFTISAGLNIVPRKVVSRRKVPVDLFSISVSLGPGCHPRAHVCVPIVAMVLDILKAFVIHPHEGGIGSAARERLGMPWVPGHPGP